MDAESENPLIVQLVQPCEGIGFFAGPPDQIIADSEKIIWVWPIRIGEQAKITSMPQKILELQIEEAK